MGRTYSKSLPSNAEIRQAWVRGMDVKDLATHFGICEKTVRRRLKDIDAADAWWERQQEQLAYRPEYV